MKARARARGPMRLLLYVAGDSPNSIVARTNLENAIAHLSKDEVVLDVIDVLSNPERGLTDGVLVTPTLVKASPSPERRIVGNLRDRSVLFMVLGMSDPNVA
jgi:circadian clock protein KaiB